MITLQNHKRNGLDRWQATYALAPDVVAGVGQVSTGTSTIEFTHSTPEDSMRFCLIRIRQQGHDKHNLQTFEDWTAIAAVLGADEANRIFGEIQRGEPWTVFPPDRMKNNSVLSVDSKAV